MFHLANKVTTKKQKKRLGLQDEHQTGVQQTGITNGVIKLVQGGFPPQNAKYVLYEPINPFLVICVRHYIGSKRMSIDVSHI